MIWEFSHYQYGSEPSVAWKNSIWRVCHYKGPTNCTRYIPCTAAQQERNVKFNVYTVGQKDGGGVLWDKERCTIGQKIHYGTQEIKKESVLIYL